MTDYLEDFDQQADALEQSRQRLEAALAGLDVLGTGNHLNSDREEGTTTWSEKQEQSPSSSLRKRQTVSEGQSEENNSQTERKTDGRALQAQQGGALSQEEPLLSAQEKWDGQQLQEKSGAQETLQALDEELTPLLAQTVALEEALAGLAQLGAGREMEGIGPSGALTQAGGGSPWMARAMASSSRLGLGWNGAPAAGATELATTGMGAAGPMARRAMEYAWDGGEADQAQRLDRIFRRDNRRYDGGFFLY